MMIIDHVLLHPTQSEPLQFLTTMSRRLQQTDGDRLALEAMLFPDGEWIWATNGHGAYRVRQSALGRHLQGQAYVIERLTRRAVTVHPVDYQPPRFADVLRTARSGDGRLEIPSMVNGEAQLAVTIVALARAAGAIFEPRYWQWLGLPYGPVVVHYHTTDPRLPVWVQCNLGEALIMPIAFDTSAEQRGKIISLTGIRGEAWI